MAVPLAPNPLPAPRLPAGVASPVVRSLEHPALRYALLGLCLWETTALTTRRVPTVSACMWRLGPFERAVIWFAAALALTDHFCWRRFL